MKLDLAGEEIVAVGPDVLWRALVDPDVLVRCIPGCRAMTEVGPDAWKIVLQLKVASVSGSFEGDVALTQKTAPARCVIAVSGAGSLGHGSGEARVELVAVDDRTTRLIYGGSGEIGGLVAGVGQRILTGVAKHLVGRFFVALRIAVAPPPSDGP